MDVFITGQTFKYIIGVDEGKHYISKTDGHTLSSYLSEYSDALKALALSIHRAETFVVFSELAANQLVHQ